MIGYVEARVVRPFAENQNLLILCITTAVVMMGFGIISPILPLYAKEFGVETAVIGFAITVFGAARLLMNLPAGFLSERFGRRILLVGGPTVVAIGSIAGGLAPTFAWLVVSRFVAGAGSAMYMTGAMIYLTDITTEENRGRMMSLYQGSLLAGVSLGPGVGGLVAEVMGLAAPFFFVAAITGIAAVWSFARMPETGGTVRPPVRPEPPPDVATAGAPARPAVEPGISEPGNVLGMLARPDFLLVCLLTMSIFLTRTGGRLTVLPLLGEERLGLSPGALGLIFTMMTVLQLIVLAPTGTMIDKLGRKAVIVPSALVTGLALAFFAFSTEVWMFVTAGVLHGIGTGIVGPAPAAYAADIAPPGMRGMSMGLFRTFGDAGFVIGPILMGVLAGVAGFSVALVFDGAIVVAFGLLFAVFAKETLGRRKPVVQPQESV